MAGSLGVVPLHGHGWRGASLGRIARAAGVRGHTTLVPRYRHRRSMPAILDELEPQVLAFAEGRPVHVAAHSLGGLVARVLLARSGVRGERVVMLGPPNAGSEWADLLFRLRLDRAVLGPIGAHLRTARAPSDEALLGTSVEGVGVVAGSRALDPVFPRLLLPGPRPR